MRLGHYNLMHWVLGTSLMVLSAGAAPSSEQIRKATLDFILEENQAEGVETIAGYVSQRVSKVARVPSRELGTLAVAAECVRLMELSGEHGISPETVRWILGTDEWLHVLIDTLEEEDDFAGVMRVMEQLYAHDGVNCDEFYELVVALAVVLDHPKRPLMHRQMGRDLLPYDPDPVWRYDYFKALYSSGQAKVDYEDLSVRELIFVIQTPVPRSELEWARQQEGGQLKDWGEKYWTIRYSIDRLNSSRYRWDSGPYMLSAIKEQGGICVDQAYYSVITARAHGIPSIFFSGAGNSANHAWFSFMERPGEWQLDIGRYGQSYTTGYATHPQTRQKMTDHDVEYTCERSLHSDKAEQASVNLTIAEVLLDRDLQGALKCAREARKLVKRYLPAWEMEYKILTLQQDYDGLMELYADQKDIFRKYPYILAESAEEIGGTLKKAGRMDDAVRIMRKLAGVVGEGQDDLTLTLELQKIDDLLAEGEMKKVRNEMEQLLENPAYRGNKSIGLIKFYVEIMNDSGQTRQAVRFLDDYVESLVRSFHFPPSYESRIWKLLQTAYENDGNLKKAAETKAKSTRLSR